MKYKKGLEDVEIQPPKILGGLKTPEYLAKNPQVVFYLSLKQFVNT